MYNLCMKKIMICTALLGVVFAAHAELERISLNGTWDFSFARDAKLSSATSDFKATDKMVVPGCFDLMPKWYAQRGLAHYRRARLPGYGICPAPDEDRLRLLAQRRGLQHGGLCRPSRLLH